MLIFVVLLRAMSLRAGVEHGKLSASLTERKESKVNEFFMSASIREMCPGSHSFSMRNSE